MHTPVFALPHQPRAAVSLWAAWAFVLAVGALLLWSGRGSFAQSAPARAAQQDFSGGLLGSKHDFTQDGGATRDLCLPCHTPHLTAAEAPLLTRRAAPPQRAQKYGALGIELSAASLLCLGCHDGVAAPDVFTGPHAMSWMDASAGGSRVRRSRITSHPVGIAYREGVEGYVGGSAVVAAGLPLPEGRIQCTTCHDPHNTHRHPGMLVISNERSRLCLACHQL